MTSTRIAFAFNQIARLRDLTDLAELLFPGNRNQQHAFLTLWMTLKWDADHLVPNLSSAACEHGISKRTLERVRAKLRRLGLIDHVSRFSARGGYREGWALSTRCERALGQLAATIATLKDTSRSSRDKDLLLLRFAAAQRAAQARAGTPDRPEPARRK